MALKDRVTPIKEAKILSESGLGHPSLFVWAKYSLQKSPQILFNPSRDLMVLGGEVEYMYPAYMVDEWLSILPFYVKTEEDKEGEQFSIENCRLTIRQIYEGWEVSYGDDIKITNKKLITALARMYIYLQNNIFSGSKK